LKPLFSEQKYDMKAINIFLQESGSMQLYVDMDGVLVNWLKGFHALTGMDVDAHDKKYGVASTWKRINAAGSKFWADMEWMPDGRQLWNYIKSAKPIILSKPSTHPSSKVGKKIWVEKHLGKDIPYIFSPDKYKWASKESVLIDDDIKNVYPWKRAGGVAVLHTSADETIAKLKNILR
jgi:hypothetical protein